MSFQLKTNRLFMQIEDNRQAGKVLDFYQRNRDLFDRYDPTRPPQFYTFDFMSTFMEIEYQDCVKGKMLRYYVYPLDDLNTLIGTVNFSRIEHGPFSRTAIGYKFDAAYHGKGYAFEACQAAIDVIFSNYRLHRIDARVAPDNLPSIRLLERLGFCYEGIELKGVEVMGQFRDHYRYGLIQN